MSSIAASTRLAQVPTSSAEVKKIEADFNRTMKKIDFEQPMLEGMLKVRGSKKPEQTAREVASELKSSRGTISVKKYLQDKIQEDKNRLVNADAEYQNQLERPNCMRENLGVSRNGIARSREVCFAPQAPAEIRAIYIQDIKAEETLLRQFK